MAAYMKYGEMLGEMTGKYRGWISLNSFQYGVGGGISSPTGTSKEASHPNVSEITVTKNYDSTSHLLYEQAIVGEGVKATIELVEPNNRVYMRIEMENARVSGYQIDGRGKATESLSINFSKISYQYTPAPAP